MWIYITGALFNVISNIIVIPKYGYIGASFTTLITETIVIFLIFWLIYKKTQYEIEFSVFKKSIVAGIIMALVIYNLKSLNILIPGIIGLLVYFPILYFIKGFTKNDLKDLIPKRGRDANQDQL